MGSHKSRDDEIYEQGVHDGQQAGALDQFSHSLVKGYTLNPRENEIYNKGYEYGVSHRPAPPAYSAASSESYRSDSGASNAPEASASDTGCAQVVGVLIGIVIVVAIALWLLANIVIPIALLNSAVIFTILGLTLKERKTVFASLALLGGCYMLVDISNGWFSANFVNNVAKTPTWLTAFVYVNAVAVAVSTWQLVRPLLAAAATVADSNKRNGALLSGGAVSLICAAGVMLPAIYHTVRNPFLDAPTAVKGPDPAQATEVERPEIQEAKSRVTLLPASRALLERADALHERGDNAVALEAYMEAVKADSNGANLDTISRYAPFRYSNPPPPPPPGKPPSDEQAVARVSALQLAALRQYLQLRPNDWEATKALLPLVDLPEGESLLDPVFKLRPRDPEPYAVRAALLTRHRRFAAAADDRAKAAALDPQNPESYFMVGVAAYEAVTQGASLTADQKRTLIGRGLTALERGETLRPDYFESIAYRNVLLRQKALLEADPVAQKKLITEADEIRRRAVEILRRRQAPKANGDPSAPSAAETGKRGYWIDDQTRLMWTVKDNGYGIDWNRASEYCSGLTLAGFNGWRLPSIDELQGIVDPEAAGRPWIYEGTTYTLKIREPIQLSSCCVWSGTKSGSSEAWLFFFHNGSRYTSELALSSPALCVRVSER
jgi:tetratricopeptide (TPR) repeat protein